MKVESEKPSVLETLGFFVSKLLYNLLMDTYSSLDELLLKLKKILPSIQEKFHVKSLEIFGSFLRGEETPESDLDLLVTFSETPGLFTFVRLENHLSDSLDVRVDLVMKDSLKPNIGERVLAEAQPI